MNNNIKCFVSKNSEDLELFALSREYSVSKLVEPQLRYQDLLDVIEYGGFDEGEIITLGSLDKFNPTELVELVKIMWEQKDATFLVYTNCPLMLYLNANGQNFEVTRHLGNFRVKRLVDIYNMTLSDITSIVFGFDINKHRIDHTSKERQTKGKDKILSYIKGLGD